MAKEPKRRCTARFCAWERGLVQGRHWLKPGTRSKPGMTVKESDQVSNAISVKNNGIRASSMTRRGGDVNAAGTPSRLPSPIALVAVIGCIYMPINKPTLRCAVSPSKSTIPSVERHREQETYSTRLSTSYAFSLSHSCMTDLPNKPLSARQSSRRLGRHYQRDDHLQK